MKSRSHFRFLPLALLILPLYTLGQSPAGPYARIAILRPNEGKTVDFEAGYIRHLEWHKQAGDPWTWYGWTLWASGEQRWFVYATFGHAAGDFDKAVLPAEDERDNIINVVPHASFVGNGLYEFLPKLSSGSGVPSPMPRIELTTVDIRPGEEFNFETLIGRTQASLQSETLWFKMIAGGGSPRYLRFRSQPNIAAVLAASNTQALPVAAKDLLISVKVEVLALRPTMSFGLATGK